MIGNIWNKTEGESISQKVMGRIKPDAPLRNKVDYAQKRLRLQISKLEAITEKLQKKHDAIFERVVSAQRAHNNAYAQAYASELVQVRKMRDMVNGARLSMEQIQLRLNTVSELGDVVVTLSPCMSIIRSLGPTLNGIMPEANESMQDLSKVMGDLMEGSSFGSTDLMSVSPGTNADAFAILDEAHSVIAGQAKEAIPDIPANLKEESVQRRPSGLAV